MAPNNPRATPDPAPVPGDGTGDRHPSPLDHGEPGTLESPGAAAVSDHGGDCHNPTISPLQHQRGPRTWRSIRAALTALLALTVLTTGCLEDLPAPSAVQGLRVLGISAEPPEAKPGETVALSALAVDTEERPISYRWSMCLLAERAAGFLGGSAAPNSGGGGYSLDDPGNCNDHVDAGVPGAVDLGTSPTATMPIGSDFFADLSIVKAAYGLPLDAEVPDFLLTGLLSIAGMNVTVTLEVTAGDKTIVSYKRVNISLAPPSDANTNPTGLAFFLYEASPEGTEDTTEIPKTAAVPSGNRCFVGEGDPNSPITIGKGTWSIAAVNVPDPAVEYKVILPALNAEQPFELIDTTESLFHSFFATGGAFERDIIKTTENTRGTWVFKEAPTEPVPVWIVTRDGRGGIAWCHSMLQPAP